MSALLRHACATPYTPPHFCPLGERLRDGLFLPVALDDAISSTSWIEKNLGRVLTTGEATRLLVSRLCSLHRHAAEGELSARVRASVRRLTSDLEPLQPKGAA